MILQINSLVEWSRDYPKLIAQTSRKSADELSLRNCWIINPKITALVHDALFVITVWDIPE